MANNNNTTCSIEGCGKPCKARGWCGMHYQRWRVSGTPDDARGYYSSPEESFEARTTWVGDCLIWGGASDSKGYGSIWVGGGYERAHRYAWERVHGEIPEGMKVDHVKHCSPSCVNVSHLRLASNAENVRHRSGPNKNSSTGVRNVHRIRNGTYQVRIKKDRREHYFGVYKTLDEAKMVAEEKRQELFGQFSGRG